MLPFPIYSIPEASEQKITPSAAWLCVVIGKPLKAENTDLLQKICTALKADFEKDVFILKADQNGAQSLTGQDCKLVLSFGIKPSMLGIWIDLPTAGIKFLEAFTFILTTDLDTLAQNPGTKKQLWEAMQIFLSLNTRH